MLARAILLGALVFSIPAVAGSKPAPSVVHNSSAGSSGALGPSEHTCIDLNTHGSPSETGANAAMAARLAASAGREVVTASSSQSSSGAETGETHAATQNSAGNSALRAAHCAERRAGALGRDAPPPVVATGPKGNTP